jgi:hypothetical protein
MRGWNSDCNPPDEKEPRRSFLVFERSILLHTMDLFTALVQSVVYRLGSRPWSSDLHRLRRAVWNHVNAMNLRHVPPEHFLRRIISFSRCLFVYAVGLLSIIPYVLVFRVESAARAHTLWSVPDTLPKVKYPDAQSRTPSTHTRGKDIWSGRISQSFRLCQQK